MLDHPGNNQTCLTLHLVMCVKVVWWGLINVWNLKCLLFTLILQKKKNPPISSLLYDQSNSKQKLIHVSSTRRQNWLDGLYTLLTVEKSLHVHAVYQTARTESTYLYVGMYFFFFNCIWIFLLATLKRLGSRQVIVQLRGNRCCHMLQKGREKRKKAKLCKMFCFFSFLRHKQFVNKPEDKYLKNNNSRNILKISCGSRFWRGEAHSRQNGTGFEKELGVHVRTKMSLSKGEFLYFSTLLSLAMGRQKNFEVLSLTVGSSLWLSVNIWYFLG